MSSSFLVSSAVHTRISLLSTGRQRFGDNRGCLGGKCTVATMISKRSDRVLFCQVYVSEFKNYLQCSFDSRAGCTLSLIRGGSSVIDTGDACKSYVLYV